MLGSFEIEKELGRGAMGIVYLGKDPLSGQLAAIKTLALAQEFKDQQLSEVKQRFTREADAARRLKHPNIVNVYSSGEIDDLAYIAMEVLEGHDLSRYCRPDNLMSVFDVIDIIINAASALDYAHQQDVIHRDIKPANIMYIRAIESIKITDFGIARIVDSGPNRTGRILGTPSYMSPEQLYGNRVDGRTDIFSLGVTFYELITGKLPFTGDSLADLMYNIANNQHQDIESAHPERSELAPGLSRIIEKALNKNAYDRYQTGAEMTEELEECLAGLSNRLIMS